MYPNTVYSLIYSIDLLYAIFINVSEYDLFINASKYDLLMYACMHVFKKCFIVCLCYET